MRRHTVVTLHPRAAAASAMVESVVFCGIVCAMGRSSVRGRHAGGDDSKAALLSSPVHFALADGACRLIPEADLADRTRLVLWTRLHARYQAVREGDVIEVANPGLLHNSEWRDLVLNALQPDFDRALGKRDDVGYRDLAP